PLPHTERAQVERPERAPHKLKHRVPHRVEHAPNNAVAARVQRQLNETLRASTIEKPGRICGYHTIIELNTRPELRDRLRGDRARHLRHVRLRDTERGVSENVRELAVVREHEQPRRVD